jgi:D-glycero-D-manno-heptose 1,7-bisphosphate phosphatase
VNGGGPARSRPAVFLDRDGTLNREVNYLSDPAEFAWLPGSRRAIARLNQAGLAAVVITNQSGIARGLFDERTLESIHARMHATLADAGARLDGVYFCPHHPDFGSPPYRAHCGCRKPLPGLLERAARELQLDLTRSWVVGDSGRDLAAGAALNLPGLLVETGQGRAQASQLSAAGEVFEAVPDLAAAVDRILG